MANQYDDDDNDDMDQTIDSDSGPANLRKALKRAEKEKKELSEQLASIQADLRSRSLKEVLASKGVSDKIAKFIPSDITAPEQIDAWLTENSDVFGFTKPEDAPANEEKEATKASYQRINAATQNATAPVRDADTVAKINGTNSREELDVLVFGQSLNRRR
jgi:hypothetical protein